MFLMNKNKINYNVNKKKIKIFLSKNIIFILKFNLNFKRCKIYEELFTEHVITENFYISKYIT